MPIAIAILVLILILWDRNKPYGMPASEIYRQKFMDKGKS